MSKTCTHPTCQGDECRRPKPEKKRTPIAKTAKPKKDLKPKRVLLTPLPKLLKQTEALCNQYVRLRDTGKPCISCGGYHTLQAGHYIAVGQCSYTRFNEFNVNGQCGGCNGPKGGNAIPYRIELRKRIGDLELEKLERDFIENKRHKWGRAELEEIKEYYRQKIAEIQGKGKTGAISDLKAAS